MNGRGYIRTDYCIIAIHYTSLGYSHLSMTGWFGVMESTHSLHLLEVNDFCFVPVITVDAHYIGLAYSLLFTLILYSLSLLCVTLQWQMA